MSWQQSYNIRTTLHYLHKLRFTLESSLDLSFGGS